MLNFYHIFYLIAMAVTKVQNPYYDEDDSFEQIRSNGKL